MLGAGCVFQGEINILGIGAALCNRCFRQLAHLVTCLAQLHLPVQG